MSEKLKETAPDKALEVPQEIKPMCPLTGVTGLSQDLYLEIMRTSEVLRQHLEGRLKQAGLSCTQYNVLRILRGGGTDGLTCQEITCRMVNRDPDVTRLLDRLEDRGLVVRARSQEDRRVVRSYLSVEGLKLVEELDDPIAQLHVEQMGHLGEKQLCTLTRTLRAVREALEAKFTK